jgi:hypothetical protein
MPSPFPGMDPYLEERDLWPGIHASLIVSLQRALVPLVRPKYHVIIEERVYEGVQGEVDIVGDLTVVGRSEPAAGSNGRGGGGLRGEGHASVLTVELPKPVEIRERYLEIRRTGSRDVVTVIEILSPSNKRRGRGRDEYEKKRMEIAGATTNLVEIDLLRAGEPLPVAGPPGGSARRSRGG